MSKIGLVIGREYGSRVKKKSFFLLTILMPILIAGSGIASILLTLEKDKHLKVLISDPENIMDSKIFIGQDEKSPPATFYFTQEALGPDSYNREDIEPYDIIIGIGRNTFTNKIIRGVYREEPSRFARNYIIGKIETRLEEFWAVDQGISLELYREIDQNFTLEMDDLADIESLEEYNSAELSRLKEEKDLNAKRQGIGFAFSILIFVFLMVYAGQVMRGVIEEKTSRVVEIVVSSVKPFELMFGKIVAVGLVGLTQFLIWIILLFIIMLGVQTFFVTSMDPEALQAVGEIQMTPGMEDTIVKEQSDAAKFIYEQVNWMILIPMFLVYFIGGYMLYASIFAIVGAAADSETDTQQLILPVMIPLLFIYFLSFTILFNGDPNSSIAVAGSYIPFSSPIIMLQRVAAGSVEIWEVVISLALLAATIFFTTYLAGKVYRTGILMYGKKASWKEIIKWLRH